MILVKAVRMSSPRVLAVLVFAFLMFSWENAAFAKGGQVLKASDIEKRALEFLADQIPWDPEMTDVAVEYKGKDIILPPGDLELNFRLPGNAMRAGRFSLSATLRVGEAVKKRIRMEARVIRSIQVVKAMRRVGRGEILTAGDVAVEIVKSNRSFRGKAARLEDVVGFEAVRNLIKGRAIRVNSLRKPPMVKKGGPVTLIVESGSMRITAPGIAREKGFKGGLVQVLNLQTQKTVFGRVVDSQTIKVNF